MKCPDYFLLKEVVYLCLIPGVVHSMVLTMHLEKFGMLLKIVCKYSITSLE